MEEKMSIDDIMEYLEKNPKELVKIFINFEEEILEFLSQYYNNYKIVTFVSCFYEREQRKSIVKGLLDTL